MSVKPVPKSPSTSPADSQNLSSHCETTVSSSVASSSDKVESTYRRNRPVVDVDSSRVFACISPVYAGMNSYEMDFHDLMLEAHMRQHARDQSRRMERECNEDLWKRIEQHLYEEAPIPEEAPKKIGLCIIL